MNDIRRRTVAGLKAGDSFTLTRKFTAKDVDAFAEVTRDRNPIHSSKRFVELKGFSDRICKHMTDDHTEAVLAYARH